MQYCNQNSQQTNVCFFSYVRIVRVIVIQIISIYGQYSKELYSRELYLLYNAIGLESGYIPLVSSHKENISGEPSQIS